MSDEYADISAPEVTNAHIRPSLPVSALAGEQDESHQLLNEPIPEFTGVGDESTMIETGQVEVEAAEEPKPLSLDKKADAIKARSATKPVSPGFGEPSIDSHFHPRRLRVVPEAYASLLRNQHRLRQQFGKGFLEHLWFPRQPVQLNRQLGRLRLLHLRHLHRLVEHQWFPRNLL